MIDSLLTNVRAPVGPIGAKWKPAQKTVKRIKPKRTKALATKTRATKTATHHRRQCRKARVASNT